LLRFGDAEVARSPCADHGHTVCPWNFRQQNASSSVLHSPSSWQRAAKLHSAPHSKQGSISNLSAESLAAATAYELHSESSRPKTPLVPSDLPSTPNAAVRIQRALAPQNLASASGSVMQLPRPSTCRALTAAGSSVPPCSLRNRNSTVFQFPSSSGVSSVDYFVTNEAKDLTRKSERQKQHRAPEQYSCSDKERWAASVQSYKTQRKCDAARFTSNPDSDDPVVQIAAKILDKTESLGSARSDPAMNALQVELKMLQAHRTMELNKLKSASRHPPANLLMRDHNLPESEPSERGQLELSLRNRCAHVANAVRAQEKLSAAAFHEVCFYCFFDVCSTFCTTSDSSVCRQHLLQQHANQPLVALKHFAAAFNVSKSISHSFRNVFALGSLAASSGDLAKAAQFFGAAINCDERQAIAHFALGSVHFLQENYREALACYDRAIELNGDIKEFFHNRALVRRRLGM
jgi:tetratricopeptide (TPR) repeat protein